MGPLDGEEVGPETHSAEARVFILMQQPTRHSYQQWMLELHLLEETLTPLQHFGTGVPDGMH